MQEQIKHVTDVVAGGTAIATIAGWLPPIAALFTIIWLGVQIYESKTVQGWLSRWGKHGR